MKRTIVGVLLLSMVFGTLTVAEAGKRKQKPRKFKTTYTCPCGVQVLGIGLGFASGNQGGRHDPDAAEREVHLDQDDR